MRQGLGPGRAPHQHLSASVSITAQPLQAWRAAGAYGRVAGGEGELPLPALPVTLSCQSQGRMHRGPILAPEDSTGLFPTPPPKN